MNKREIKQLIVQKEKAKSSPKVEPHHSGKGTKARVNTMAEKLLFNSKVSD